MTAPALVLGILSGLLPDGGLEWAKDYATAQAEARRQGRLILLHFTLAGRPLCQVMEEETLAQPEVRKAAGDRFVSVRVDAERSPELFDRTVGGRGGLATCIVDADGDVVSALHGYAGPRAFLEFLGRAERGYPALAAARRAATDAPGDLDKLQALGDAYRDLDSLRRAEACYLRVIERGEAPGAPAERPARALALSHERVARLRIMRGKNLEAREHLEAYRKLDPDGRWGGLDRVLLTEALTLAVERKHLESAGVLRTALARFPSSAEADHMLYALGFVLHQAGQDQPALEALESALRTFPQSGWLPAVREQLDHIRNPQPDHLH